MPLYDYACPDCGAVFEVRLPAAAPAPACPECGGERTEKRLTPFAMGSTVRPRGLAARRSDATRRAREEQRAERREQRRSGPDQG